MTDIYIDLYFRFYSLLVYINIKQIRFDKAWFLFVCPKYSFDYFYCRSLYYPLITMRDPFSNYSGHKTFRP